MTLEKWENDKFVPGEDLAGTDVSSLTEANFFKSATVANLRAVTVDDIRYKGIDFSMQSPEQMVFMTASTLIPPIQT